MITSEKRTSAKANPLGLGLINRHFKAYWPRVHAQRGVVIQCRHASLRFSER